MSQPQNPQSPPLLARFSVNNDGLDLLQVLNSGSGVIWRLNQFQATWYVGSGVPIFIPGQLPEDLYLDNTSGHVWQVQLDGITWVELPAPGGGGGGGVTSLNLLTGDIDIVGGSGINTTVVGNNITVSNTGVLTLNNIFGNPIIQPGSGISVSSVGSNITIGNTGLLSLNAITGAAIAAAGTGISIVPTGSTLTFNNLGLLSLNAITGAAVIAPGTGISITPSGSTLNIANTGLLALNGLTGSPSITAGGGVTVSVSGSSIQIGATTGSIPWVDIQSFGTVPKQFVFNQPTASATTTASSPNVTISSGTFASTVGNGQGVCIWKAGPATTQSTPSAPTATAPVVQGSQTITYQCVGYDSRGGLTAASASGTVTNAPAVFSSRPAVISSISLTSNVVTANFATPLNNTVTAGMTIHIVGVTGAGSSWNGIWTIASAPTTSQITFAFNGSNGSGTVSASSTGRVSNSAIVSAITRTASGTVTVTTAQNHNFQVGSSLVPTIVLIENCFPFSLNGWFVISSVTSNTITVNTGVLSAVTGTLTAGSSTATVWEYLEVACPVLSGTTVGYYIYSDSPNPGGSLVLIGRCIYGERHFEDWGQLFAAGYQAPGYVPTSPPVSAQNQMFTSTVVTGAGSTSLVLANNVITSIPALGATILFDDGPNLVAACTAVSGSTSIGGAVFLSAPSTHIQFGGYIFNSPITIPQFTNLIFACECIINETIFLGGYNQVSAQFGQNQSTQNFQFSTRNFMNINGIGNPMMMVGITQNVGSMNMWGLGFTNNCNGTCGVQIQSVFYNTITDCLFQSSSPATQGTAIGIIANGGCSLSQFGNINLNFKNRFANGVSGQSSWGAPIPAIWFRSSDNSTIPNYNLASDQITFDGQHSADGRGILFDHVNATGKFLTQKIYMGYNTWYQAGNTPLLMFSGGTFQGVDVINMENDTSFTAIIANWGIMQDVSIRNCSIEAGYSCVTGNQVIDLSASGNSAQFQSQLQRLGTGSFTSTSGTSDTVLVTGCTGTSIVTLTATNQSAAIDMAAGLAYVNSIGSGFVVVSHSNTPGMSFVLTASVGN